MDPNDPNATSGNPLDQGESDMMHAFRSSPSNAAVAEALNLPPEGHTPDGDGGDGLSDASHGTRDGDPDGAMSARDASDDTLESGRTPGERDGGDEAADPDADAANPDGEPGEERRMAYEFELDEDGNVFSNGISSYKTPEALVKGHDAALKHIQRLSEEKEGAETALAEREALLDRYRQVVPDDRLDEITRDAFYREELQKELPEGTNVDDVLKMSDEELEDDVNASIAVRLAKRAAEKRLSEHKEKTAGDQQERSRKLKDRQEDTTKVVTESVKALYDDSAFKNPEAQGALTERLSRKIKVVQPDGTEQEQNVLNAITQIGFLMGPDVAKMLLENEGLRVRSDLALGRRESIDRSNRDTKPNRRNADPASGKSGAPGPDHEGKDDFRAAFANSSVF